MVLDIDGEIDGRSQGRVKVVAPLLVERRAERGHGNERVRTRVRSAPGVAERRRLRGRAHTRHKWHSAPVTSAFDLFYDRAKDGLPLGAGEGRELTDVDRRDDSVRAGGQ